MADSGDGHSPTRERAARELLLEQVAAAEGWSQQLQLGKGLNPQGQDTCRGRGTKDRLCGTLSCSHSSVAVPQEPVTRQEGAGRATPPPKQAQGSPQWAATYSSGCRQPVGIWAGGEGEPTEREETRLLLQAAAAPLSQQASGGNASQPPHTPSLFPTLQHPRAHFLQCPSGTGCDFIQGLHVKL